MSYTTILVTEEDGVRTITLNRPERRNAMTPEMQDGVDCGDGGGCGERLLAWWCLLGRARRFVRGWI